MFELDSEMMTSMVNNHRNTKSIKEVSVDVGTALGSVNYILSQSTPIDGLQGNLALATLKAERAYQGIVAILAKLRSMSLDADVCSHIDKIISPMEDWQQ